MINKEQLKKAFVEVQVILKQAPEEEIIKIPKKFIEFMEKNKHKNYEFNYDNSKELEDQNLLQETKILLSWLYLNYLADENEKKELNKILDENESNYIKQINEAYSVEAIFEKRKAIMQANSDNQQNTNLPIEYHENIIKKIISFIKRIFRKKGVKL